ncbi:unannotated protein [freshwater metagenome]|uniref:Unannotated protein n=1 Tax=freshwater metagenome TaxID=449393 RepID=A0A6J7GHZ5_9ZZZZ|nr:DUF4126 family protein [Actinomycetota bacterium]
MLITNLLGAIGLGASSGLNAWIPLLGLGLAQRFGVVELSSRYDQLGSTWALAILGVLFVIDLIGDKIVVIDHVLHAVGLVIAPVSGAIVFSAQAELLSGSHPVLAALAGILLGGTMHAGRSALRPVVSAGTGGLGNPVVSLIEDVMAAVMVFLAILVPVISFIVLLALVFFSVRWIRKRRQRKALRSQAVSEVPNQVPSQLPPQLPSQLPSQLPHQLPHQLPSQLPAAGPSTAQPIQNPPQTSGPSDAITWE